MGPSSSEHLQVRDYNLIDQSFRIQFSSDAQQESPCSRHFGLFDSDGV